MSMDNHRASHRPIGKAAARTADGPPRFPLAAERTHHAVAVGRQHGHAGIRFTWHPEAGGPRAEFAQRGFEIARTSCREASADSPSSRDSSQSSRCRERNNPAAS